MRNALIGAAAAALLAACNQPTQPTAEPAAEVAASEPAKVWTFADGAVFPADRSLHRPESGVVLSDGTLVVVDQLSGLVAVSADGTTRPFGNFAAAGYVHAPPTGTAGPNGVAFEPDGKHLLVADVFSGALYRTDIETETTTRVYQHPYGVNYAHRDSTGAIWFTQSTENAPPNSEERLFSAFSEIRTDGVLFRIAPVAEGEPLPAPVRVIDGLYFANGFTIDEARGKLYLAETGAGQITSYTVDLAAGTVSDRAVLATVATPDNVEAGPGGTLWVASPISNEVIEIDPDTGETRVVFSAQTEAGAGIVAEANRRTVAGEPVLDLITPQAWEPMPGLVTGVIHTPGGGPVYVSGLGDALLKLEE